MVSAFERLCERQIREGATALVVCGTTGEASTLSRAEHDAIVRMAIGVAQGRVPVVAGAGSNATSHAIELSRDAEAAGADALLSVVPYYNKPMQAGIYAHFRAIADAAGLPIILYDVPSRTVCGLADDTLARLAECSKFIGLKDATGDLARPARLRARLGSEFRLLSGDDATAAGFIGQGGNGCISVTSNVGPGLCRSMYLASKQGHTGSSSSARRGGGRIDRCAVSGKQSGSGQICAQRHAVDVACGAFAAGRGEPAIPRLRSMRCWRIVCEGYSGYMIGERRPAQSWRARIVPRARGCGFASAPAPGNQFKPSMGGPLGSALIDCSSSVQRRGQRNESAGRASARFAPPAPARPLDPRGCRPHVRWSASATYLLRTVGARLSGRISRSGAGRILRAHQRWAARSRSPLERYIGAQRIVRVRAAPEPPRRQLTRSPQP